MEMQLVGAYGRQQNPASGVHRGGVMGPSRERALGTPTLVEIDYQSLNARVE